MREAVKKFNNSKDADLYIRNLLRVCRNLITREDSFVINTWTTFSLVNATASQHADAFLMTIGEL